MNAKQYRAEMLKERARVVALEGQLVRACELLGKAVGSTDIPEPTITEIRNFISGGARG